MPARSPHEAHRTATPLELLFDLVFVVAIAQAGEGLHHAVAGHALEGLVGYLMVFFAIWWAWMNFTWFASAYDCDDVPYRLAVFVQIAGALVMAGGVSQMFEQRQPNAAVLGGYVLMRLALVGQWLRAAAADPPHRTTALRYAVGRRRRAGGVGADGCSRRSTGPSASSSSPPSRSPCRSGPSARG